MRDLPHSHSVSRHSPFCTDGARRTTSAQDLVEIRHGERRFSTGEDVARTTCGRVCLVLRAAVLTPLHLAQAPGRSHCRAAVSRDVVPLQTLEPILASADPQAIDRLRLEAARRVDSKTPPPLSRTTG